jgi:hypothetical protein
MTNNRKYKGGSAQSVMEARNLMNARQANANQSGGESSPASVPAPSPTTVALQGNNNIPVLAPSGSSDQNTIMLIKNTQNQGIENNKTDIPGQGLKGGKKRKTKRKTKRNKKLRKSKSRKSRSIKSRSRK